MPILSQSVFLIQVIPGLEEGLKTMSTLTTNPAQHANIMPILSQSIFLIQVIPGLDEGLKTMSTGGIRRLYIPGELAFPKGLPAGERGESTAGFAAYVGIGRQALACGCTAPGSWPECALNSNCAELKVMLAHSRLPPTVLPCHPALQPRGGRACRLPVPWCLMCSCCTSPAFRTTRSRAERPNDLKLDWQPCKHVGAAPLLAAGVGGPRLAPMDWLADG